MKILYRPHRGMLADAMAESRAFQSIPEAREFIANSQSSEFFKIAPADIVCEHYGSGEDKRIGWQETYILTVKNWGVIGFTDTDINNQQGNPNAN